MHVVTLKGKKGITITNALQKSLDESKRRKTKNGQMEVVNFKIDR